MLEILAPVAAAISAGIAWNTIGIWEKWRNHEDAAIDWVKVRKNAIIGAGLGVATWGYALATGNPDPIINTANGFVLAVAGYFPVVVVVEKLLNRPDK